MKPIHHLDPASLMSYSAGALPPAFAVVAATHLSICQHCRENLKLADHIGGVLLGQQEPDSAAREAREAMLERLKTATPEKNSEEIADTLDPDALPLPLRSYFGDTYSELPWRMVAPGIHRIAPRRQVAGGNLMLLRVAPGKSIPEHSHGKNEMTCILRGSYDDALGHFGPGDLADLDSEITHQPITAPGLPCICVAATDAPLRFSGWFARALQPFFSL